MSEQALEIARERIKRVFAGCSPELAPSQLDDLSSCAIALIDWDNPVLMHKGLGWIAKEFLAARQVS